MNLVTRNRPGEYNFTDYPKLALDLKTGAIYISGISNWFEDTKTSGTAIHFSQDGGKTFKVRNISAKDKKSPPQSIISLTVGDDSTLYSASFDYFYKYSYSGGGLQTVRISNPEVRRFNNLEDSQNFSFESFRVAEIPGVYLYALSAARMSNTSERLWNVYGGPEITADTNASSNYKGRLYVLWAQPEKFINGSVGQYGYNFDIFLAYSDDKGSTWSQPVRVNDDPGLSDQFFPSFKIDSRGVVHIVFIDRRNTQDKNFYDVYYTASFDGGKTFSKNLRVNEESVPSGSVGGRIIGDYLDLVMPYDDRVYVAYPCSARDAGSACLAELYYPGAPAVVVVSPVGRERFLPEQLVNVKWKSSGSIDTVKIVLQRDGKDIFTIGTVPNTGNYSWKTPTGYEGEGYTIKVVDARDSSVYGVSGASFSFSVNCDSYGDINSDGELEINDAMLVAQYLAGTISFTEEQKLRADVDQDGNITSADIGLISNYSAGNISVFPACLKKSSCGSGDVNNNGYVNLRDVSLVANYDVGNTTLTDQQKKNADVNADGNVNIIDAMFIAQYIAGQRASLCLSIDNVKIGDVNKNGSVDIGDSLLISQYIVGQKTLDSAQLTAADVNKDGEVTTNDAKIIAQYLVGKYGSLPVANVKVGDVNKDGKVDIIDAMFIAQYLAGQRTFDAIQEAAADVNNDSQITQADVDAIVSYDVGNIKKLPIPYVAPTTTLLFGDADRDG